MLPVIAALFIFQLIGEVLVQWLALPVSGPLIGMVLLFGASSFAAGYPRACARRRTCC